ncbi:unnamed protein product [Heterobilharzia americana]|nr:unnamed protein product [Heterobilharzia americana]
MNPSESCLDSSCCTSRKGVSNPMRFLINQDLIKRSHNQETDCIQRIVVYDHSEFESSVVRQANDAFKKHNNLQVNTVRDRLSALDDDIISARKELEEMEKLLDNLLSELSTEAPTNRSENRKIRSLELEIETKMKHIDTLTSRKAALMTKLSTLEKATSIHESNFCEMGKKEDEQAVSGTRPLFQKALDIHKSHPTTQVHKEKRRKNNYREISKFAKFKQNDDANVDVFQERLKRQRRMNLLEKQLAKEHSVQTSDPADGKLGDGFCVPGSIWCRLFDYQRKGVSWLWSLHQKGCGGIVGDEMGLGKTIQIIALLAGLHHSKVEDKSHRSYLSACNSSSEAQQDFLGLGPTLIVCPATVLRQWMSEFHSWWPPIRVAILHSTGSGYRKPINLIQSISNTPGSVLLTTYATLVAYRDVLTSRHWSYIILDEGHKIKNPEAEATLAVKHFSTPHRLILSGSPIQNNLRELWSLFDFVCPGRLGPLQEFMQQFSIPITQGGYASASPLQVETAYQCACTLRDLLKPYLIRRLKADVQIQLPSKSEQVLFCRLTEYQRKLYQEYLESQTCKDLLNGKGNIFPALILLRNLCNHPDLATGGPRDSCFLNEEFEADKQGIEDVCLSYSWSKFGCPRRSSKMLVVASLLKNWFDQGHKVLLFSQSRRMLTLLERLVQLMEFSYLRMDGTTPVSQRHELIRRFNYHIFIFLLTTRVGGLGVNLTSANRVLIYDPDWNPTTDLQARERAWRIGQLRDVIVYRLLTSGTIEEKIYHRQIFKQFLTNRILKNPRQQRFFKTNDLQELLSFQDGSEMQTPETALYLQSEGMGHTLTSSSASDNRFDIRARKLKDDPAQNNLPDLDTESDCGDEEKEVEDDDVAGEKNKIIAEDSMGCSSLKTDPQDERRMQLRKLAKEISRRIAEDCLDKDDSFKLASDVGRYKGEKSSNKKHTPHRKRKSCIEGTQVDGKRIKLVSRRCKYDLGEGVDLSLSRDSHQHSKPNKSTRISSEDDFIRTILPGPCSVRSYSASEQDYPSVSSSVTGKRSIIDQDTRDEASRIANEALKNIQKFYKSNEIKSKQPTERNLDYTKKSSSMQTSKTKHSNHRDNYLSSRVSSSSAEATSYRSTPFICQVTQIIQHDQLLEEMTNPNHIDVSFDQLRANRLASRAITELQEEVNRWQQSNLSSFQNNEHSVHGITYPFGQAKNRFLWNPAESTSFSYMQLLQSSNEFGDTTQSGYHANTAKSHVRFSSELLFNLIRLRKISRDDHSSISSESVNAVLDRSIQRLCAELIRILSGSNFVTSEYLAVHFKAILNRKNSCDSDSPHKCLQNGTEAGLNKTVTGLHFRSLLKQLAVRNRSKRDRYPPDLHSRGRLDDMWILRDKFRSIASYLSMHLGAAERLDQPNSSSV